MADTQQGPHAQGARSLGFILPAEKGKGKEQGEKHEACLQRYQGSGAGHTEQDLKRQMGKASMPGKGV